MPTPISKHDAIAAMGRAVVLMDASEREAVLRAKSGVRTQFMDRRVDHPAPDADPTRLRVALQQAIAEALADTGQSLAPVDDLTALIYEAATAVAAHDRPADDDESVAARDWRRLVAPFGSAVP